MGENSFGKQLRVFRRNTKDPHRGGAISQERLADLLSEDYGIIYSRAAISDWERGRGHIHKDSRGILVSLIKILNDYGGIGTSKQANEWLELGNYRRLDAEETEKISTKWLSKESYSISSTTLFSTPSLPGHKIVGRGKLLQKLKDRLFSGHDLALSAINGLPGVGKTTMAMVLAHDDEVQQFFPDGILWVGLGRNPDIFQQLGQWAINLGIPTQKLEKMGANRQRANAIHNYMYQKRMLIVIDDVWDSSILPYFKLGGKNCIHILTTRKPQIAREFAGKDVLKVDELSEEFALKLLYHLAPEIESQYPEEAIEIAKNTGGLPLSLVLVANHLRVQLATGRKRRVKKALERLTFAESRLGLKKHQPIINHEIHPSLPKRASISLKTIIEASDDALTSEAKMSLRALSFFPPKPNSFTEDAAVALLKNEILSEAELFDVLDELSDHGLIETTKQERYTLHQSIYDYAKVESPNFNVFIKMVSYYIQFVKANRENYSTLDKELENITATMQRAKSKRELESLWELLDTIFPFLEARGYYDLALEPLTKLANGNLPQKAKANIQIYIGRIAYKRNQNNVAEYHWKRGLELFQEASLSEDALSVLSHLSVVTSQNSDYELAERYLLDATEIAKSIDNKFELCRAQANLGRLALISDRYLEADSFLEKALAIATNESYASFSSAILNMRGLTATSLGAKELAEQYYYEGLKIARSNQFDSRVLAIMTNLGHLLRESGKNDKAQIYLEESLELARKFEDRAKEGHILMDLGVNAFQMSNFKKAHEYMQSGYDIASMIDNFWLLGLIDSRWGLIKIATKQFDEAKNHFDNAQKFALKASNNKEIIGLIQLGLAQLALHANQPSLASKQLKKGLEVLEGSGHDLANELKRWGKQFLPSYYS